MVVYGNFRVSDERVREALERIADVLGRGIVVTSGDRGHVPAGGAKSSLHLLQHAADFHCNGLADADAFDCIRSRRHEIFGNVTGLSFRYQLIHHGRYTSTQGEHLHLGWVPESLDNLYRGFVVEGLTPETKGKYKLIVSA